MRNRFRTLIALTALITLPTVAWAIFSPVPGTYKAKSYAGVSPFPTSGKIDWKFIPTLGKLKYKGKWTVAQPGGDGVPCSGDELVCVVDMASAPGAPTSAQLIFRAEVGTAGFTAAVTISSDPDLTQAIFGFTGVNISSAACYPAQLTPPFTVTLTTHTCSGWYQPASFVPTGAPVTLF